MPGPYTFGQIFAADPHRTENVAKGGEVLIFAPGDAAKTPLALTGVSGGPPLRNPVQVNENGFGPAFMANLDQVAWEGGGFTGTFESYKGMKDEAVAARGAADGAKVAADASAGSSATSAAAAELAKLAAEAAGASAGQTAADEVQVQLGAAVAAAEAAAALVEAPADDVTATLVGNPETLTGRALSAAYAPDGGGKPVGKGEIVISVKDYGAKGDGVTDDTAALNVAANAVFALDPDAVLMMPRGKYAISGPVNVKCALEASQATLNYTGVGDALIIGNISSPGTVTSRRTYVLPRVVRMGASSYDGSSRGVRLVNLNSCIITSQFIQHFEEGMVFEGYAQGVVHNVTYPGTLWGNRRNIVLRADLTGWVNENLYFGGRLSSPAWGIVDDPLANHILIEESLGEIASPNSNRFFGTSIEGANKHLYRVDVSGNYNVFDYCRWEHPTGQVARIRYRTSANYTVLNGGYDQYRVVEVFDGATIGNKRTTQTGSVYVTSKQLSSTSLANAVLTDITTWAGVNGFYYAYNATTGEVTPRPGRYLIRARIPFSSSAAAGDRTVRILKGSTVEAVTTVAGKADLHTVETSAVVNFNGIESFKVQAQQNSGAAAPLSTSVGYATLSAELI